MRIAEVRFKATNHVTFIFTTTTFENEKDVIKQAKAHFTKEMPDRMEAWKTENITTTIKEVE